MDAAEPDPPPELAIPAAEAAEWVRRHRARLAVAVLRCDDVAALWRIAVLCGYDDGEAEAYAGEHYAERRRD